MRKFRTLAASAAALVLCFSASQAFAGLTLVSAQNSQYSWQMSFTASASSTDIGGISTGFNKIVATQIPGAYSYFVNPNNATITNPSFFEDLGPGASAATHNAWDGWTGHNAFSDSSWAQSSSNGGGSSTITTATGNLINPFTGGSGTTSLSFTLDFTGGRSTLGSPTGGAHYTLDFQNGSVEVARYLVTEIFINPNSDGTGGTPVLELTAIAAPLPTSVWAGLTMFAGMGVFFMKRRRDRSLAA